MTAASDRAAALGEVPSSARIAVGASVEVRLPGQLGAGYSWSAVDLPKGLTVVGESTLPNGSALDGRRDVQLIRLRGDVPGGYVARFVYRRPFEKDVAPARTVEHRIEVTG